MAKPWKDFEELVARIERVLAPAGAIVKSNDWIVNHVTGRKRQVDASIRYNIGTVPGLITIECRKRKKIQDDTWIEQLATKRANLRADRTIAVSATPVSSQAIKTAAHYLIEVRQLSEISEEDIRGWLKIGSVTHSSFMTYVRSVRPFLYAAPGESVVEVSQGDLLEGKDLRQSDLFVWLPSGDMINSLDVFNKFLGLIQKSIQHDKHRPTKDNPKEAEVQLRLGQGAFGFLTKNGIRDLAFVRFKIQICLEESFVVPVDRRYQYSCPGGSLVAVGEAHAEFLGMNIVVAFHKKEGASDFKTSVHIDTKKPGAKKPD